MGLFAEGMWACAHWGPNKMLCWCLCLLVLQPCLQPQFKDKPDVLKLMIRHPSWPAASSDTPAAAAAGQTAANAGAAAAQPAIESRPGSAGAEQDPSDFEDSEDAGSLDAGGVSDDAEHDMQDAVMSVPAAAAKSLAALGRGIRSHYTDEEKGVMRELDLSHLAYIQRRSSKSGESRWRVLLSAEGLPARQGESMVVQANFLDLSIHPCCIMVCMVCAMHPCTCSVPSSTHIPFTHS